MRSIIAILLCPVFLYAQIMPLPARYNIILCVGQSNMSGTGILETQDNNSGAYLWNNTGWEQADGKLNRYSNIQVGGGGLSPANQFGKDLAVYPIPGRGYRAGLVVNAQAGSSITAWADSLMLKSIQRTRAAKLANTGNRVTAVLIHQGETDRNNPAIWRANFREVRQQVDSLLGYNVPIIAGGICQIYTTMNDTIQAVVASTHDCYYVSSAGLACPDWFHFVSAGCRVLGNRYYQMYYSIYD